MTWLAALDNSWIVADNSSAAEPISSAAELLLRHHLPKCAVNGDSRAVRYLGVEVDDALAMSESTVKAHVKQIIKRLNVANRTQAALIATGTALSPQQGRLQRIAVA